MITKPYLQFTFVYKQRENQRPNKFVMRQIYLSRGKFTPPKVNTCTLSLVDLRPRESVKEMESFPQIISEEKLPQCI